MVHELRELQQSVRAFAAERDWDQFHTPKNLAMAIAGEVGELIAEMQWLSDREIHESLSASGLREKISHEAADVFIYLLRLADVCDFDLHTAATHKIEINRSRYPVRLARGTARKYSDLEGDGS